MRSANGWGASLYPGTGQTVPQSYSNFESITGVPVTTAKIYMEYTSNQYPTTQAEVLAVPQLQWAADNPQIRVCLCFEPDPAGGDVTILGETLTAMYGAGVTNACVVLWQEVQNYSSTVSASQFISLMATYRPVIQGVYGNVQVYNSAGSAGPASWTAYDPYPNCDIYAVDLYCRDTWMASPQIVPDPLIELAHSRGLPWAIFETGVTVNNETPPADSDVIAMLEYFQEKIVTDLEAALPVDSCMWYWAPLHNDNNDPTPYVQQIQAIASTFASNAGYGGGLAGLTGYVTGQTTEQTWNQWASNAGPGWPVMCTKDYYSVSDGSGAAAAFPTTAGEYVQQCIDTGATLYACYKPAVNSGLTSFDGTPGNGSNSGHGGTPADWNALKASLQAYKTAGLTRCKVILWQEVEHSLGITEGGTPVQYFSLLAYMASAINAVYPGSMLHDSSSVAYARWAEFFPGPPNIPHLLVTGAGIDYYGTRYAEGVTLDGTPNTAGLSVSRSYLALCDAAGCEFTGCPELGISVGSENPPPAETCYDYLEHVYTICAGRLSPQLMCSWYMATSTNPSNLIPGYSSGQAGGPDMITSDAAHSFRGLRALADLITAPSAPLVITSTSLPDATLDVPYPPQMLTAVNGTPPYSWALTPTSGPLPAGMTLAASGMASGTPTQAGKFIATVQVTDAASNTATAQLTLAVNVVSPAGSGTELLTLAGGAWVPPAPEVINAAGTWTAASEWTLTDAGTWA